MRRNLFIRTIAGESGYRRVRDLPISPTAGSLASKACLVERCITLLETRRATSGFPSSGIFCICWTVVWSSRSRGQSWDVTNRPTIYSLSKAECGSDSGSTEAFGISRIASAAPRTQPLMAWGDPPSSIFNAIGMGRCGPQRRMAA